MTEKLMKKISEGRQYRPTAEMLRIKERVADQSEGSEEMIVEGHATTFNQPYTLYEDSEFKIDEQIDAHAFDDCDVSDVIFQYNHEGRVFARTRNNTLELQCDDVGLNVKANLGGTEEGRKLYQEIKDGYTDRMSFGFTVLEDDVEEVEGEEKEAYLRTIKRIGKLYDVSAVSIPANDGTDISARSFSDGLIAKINAERQERRANIELAKAKAKALLNF